MVLSYENTPDDYVAFVRYQWAHAASFKSIKWGGAAVLILGTVAVSYLFPPDETLPRIIVVLTAAAVGTIAAAVLLMLYPMLLDRLIRSLIKKSMEQGLLGRHDLELSEDALIERTNVSETTHSLQGLTDIAQTSEHVFISFGLRAVLLIPRSSVIEGDPTQLIHRIEQFQQPHPSAHGS